MAFFNSKAASRIVGVSLRQIQYWDERGFIRPSVRAATGRGSKRLYSFMDLVQLKIVKNLTNHGLSLQKIRRCLVHLRRDFPQTAQSLSSLKYVTDGDKLFVLTSDRSKILDVMERQFVFSLGLGHLVRELNGELRRTGERLTREVPKGRRKHEGKKTVIA